MSEMKEEALKLADFIEEYMVGFDVLLGEVTRDHLIETIRKLVAELDKQGEPVAWMSPDGKVSTTEGKLFHIPLYTAPQTKPLSDEEIEAIYTKVCLDDRNQITYRFARAIEERHGIK